MATHSATRTTAEADTTAEMRERIETAVNEKPYEPWCVHRLHEELSEPDVITDREHMPMVTQLAADQLAAAGRLEREEVNAITIGVHCQDTLYWSTRAGMTRVEQFGPDYESPAVLRRLGAHFRCHGL